MNEWSQASTRLIYIHAWRGANLLSFSFYVHTKTCQVIFISVRICPKHTHRLLSTANGTHANKVQVCKERTSTTGTLSPKKLGNASLAATISFSTNSLLPWNWLISISQEWFRSMELVGIGCLRMTAPWSWLVTAVKLWIVKCEDECEEWTFRNSYNLNLKKVKQSRNRPGVAQRVPGDLGSQISWHSTDEGGEVVSLTHRPPLPPGSVPGTRGWVDPKAMVRSEGIRHWKIQWHHRESIPGPSD